MSQKQVSESINTLINWAQTTDMKTISVEMLLDWFIELKAQEIEKIEGDTLYEF